KIVSVGRADRMQFVVWITFKKLIEAAGRPRSCPSCDVSCAVDYNSVQPGGELALKTEAASGSVKADQSIRHGVGSLLVISGDSIGSGMKPLLVLCNEFVERLLVAF